MIHTWWEIWWVKHGCPTTRVKVNRSAPEPAPPGESFGTSKAAHEFRRKMENEFYRVIKVTRRRAG